MNNGFFLENFTDEVLDKHIGNKMNDVVQQTLQTHCGYDSDVFISLVDGQEIRRLNLQARGLDKETDVLSFPYIDFSNCQSLEHAAASVHMLNPETGRLMLGDIIICLPVAKTQAEEYGHTLLREMCFLIVHGLLHLLGFDHENEDEASIMFGEQNNILERCNISR